MKKSLFIIFSLVFSNLSFSGDHSDGESNKSYLGCVLKCKNNGECEPSGKKYICHKVFSSGSSKPICVSENSDHGLGFVHGGDFPDFPLNGDLPNGYSCEQFVTENINDLKIKFDPCEGEPNNYKITGEGNLLNIENLANPEVSLNGLHYDATWDLCVKFNITQTNPNSPWPLINPVMEVQQDLNISNLIEEGDPNYLRDSGLTLQVETLCNPNVFSDVNDPPSFIGEEVPIMRSFLVTSPRYPYPSECRSILHFKETSGGERGLPGTKMTISLQNSAEIIFKNNLTY